MKTHLTSLSQPLALVLLFVMACPAPAADIYRWTDEAGRVHYGERPPVDDAQRLSIDHTPSQSRALPDEAERRARQQRLLESYEYERARKAEQQAEEEKRERRRARECEELRRYWKTLQFAGPVYVEGDDGQRRYLDDAEREIEQGRLRPRLEKACGRVSD
jgi:hypothetical protein